MAAKKEPVEVVEQTSVSVSDGVTTLVLNDRPFSLSQDALHHLRRLVDAAYVETN